MSTVGKPVIWDYCFTSVIRFHMTDLWQKDNCDTNTLRMKMGGGGTVNAFPQNTAVKRERKGVLKITTSNINSVAKSCCYGDCILLQVWVTTEEVNCASLSVSLSAPVYLLWLSLHERVLHFHLRHLININQERVLHLLNFLWALCVQSGSVTG